MPLLLSFALPGVLEPLEEDAEAVAVRERLVEEPRVTGMALSTSWRLAAGVVSLGTYPLDVIV